MRSFRALASTAALIAVSLSASAYAQPGPPPPEGGWGPGEGPPGPNAAWLADCEKRMSDNGLGGALIGGVAGGLAGRAIAGKGDRTAGTIAGAAVGAAAGAVIDKAEDRRRIHAQCMAMMGGYGYPGGYPQGYGYPAYGYAVPVMMVPVGKPDCKETETVEYVTYYETVRRRVVKKVYVPVPDKRVRITPKPSGKLIRIK